MSHDMYSDNEAYEELLSFFMKSNVLKGLFPEGRSSRSKVRVLRALYAVLENEGIQVPGRRLNVQLGMRALSSMMKEIEDGGSHPWSSCEHGVGDHGCCCYMDYYHAEADEEDMAEMLKRLGEFGLTVGKWLWASDYVLSPSYKMQDVGDIPSFCL